MTTSASVCAVRLRLMVMLAEGATRFSRPAPTFERRLHVLLAAAPSKGWTSSQVALGVSGATLRRKLAKEGTSCRDVRLHHGVQLLQTDPPLERIAFECGLRSLRFGLPVVQRVTMPV